jgi:hypothetical protein
MLKDNGWCDAEHSAVCRPTHEKEPYSYPCQSQTEAILTSNHTTTEPLARLAIALLDQRGTLLGSFENHFNIGFLHRLPQIQCTRTRLNSSETAHE